MAKIPATIITTLIAMDHPKDFLTIVGTELELAAALLMSIPPTTPFLEPHCLGSKHPYRQISRTTRLAQVVAPPALAAGYLVGGKFLNSLSIAFSTLFVSFSGFSDNASVANPRHISCFVRESNISIMIVPTS
ncbi:MAG: hypothetical protein WB723_09720 [Candidatus Acidiferrales bacterium]